MTLTKRIHELEEKLNQQRSEMTDVQGDHDDILKEARMKEQTQNIEILTLKKACEMQKEDIEALTQENNERSTYSKELMEKNKEDMLRLEEQFDEEMTRCKERLREVFITISF